MIGAAQFERGTSFKIAAFFWKVGETMKITLARLALGALIIGSLAACGGGGGGGGGAAPPPATDLSGAIATAAADPANDSATNPNAAFTVIQNAGQPVVTVASAPKVRFTVFSDGKVVTGLTTSNVRFNLAKLIRGSNGDPDDWANYVYTTETAAAGVGPGGSATPPATAKQATTDPRSAPQLVYNSEGYYTYTFSTDITTVTDPLDSTKKLWDPTATHRIGIQLSYTNAAGETVQVNPYFDFKFDSSNNSVAITDPAQTRKVVDVSSCNQCHDRLAHHGGGRVDPQYCVLCHNSRTTDANSGNNLRLKTMVHKIHAGKREFAQGEDYVIWGFDNEPFYAREVGFPQDLRNCTKCHDNAKAPQADNWKQRPSKEACLTCHQSGPATAWYDVHITTLGLGTTVANVTNAACADCHGPGKTFRPDQVHFNQIEVNAAKYKMNIESAAYDSGTRKVTVKYYLSDPTNNDARYDLSASQFSGLRLLVGYPNMPGQPTTVTEFSSYNNGGNGVSVVANTGTNDGTNKYTATTPAIPADDPATMVAAGTARIFSYGAVVEPKLDPVSRDPAVPADTVNVAVQHAFKEFAISGSLTPRRTVVANAKCNSCHSTLGTGSASNTLENAFHGGARNLVEACVICHDPNRVSSTVMADGSSFNESYQFKRMIHGLHGGTKRTYPFTHGNVRVDSYDKKCVSTTDMVSLCTDSNGLPISDPASGVENFTAEVAYPGILQDCNACHVNDSWKQDRGVLGAGVNKGTVTNRAFDDLVISPKAATCTACHDSIGVKTHVVNQGGATFGTMTQAQFLQGFVFEVCEGCHEVGGIRPVDKVHGLK